MRKAGNCRQTGIPRAGSVGEETLALHLNACGISYEREVCLIPDRKWRYDFLIGNIVIEVDGGTWAGGRHTRGFGFQSVLKQRQKLKSKPMKS
jgi:hypothetical protein